MSVKLVGIGELAVTAGVGEGLRTVALGSCVGIVAHDRVRRVLGLAHVVLPSSEPSEVARKPAAYFADLAVARLLEALRARGSGPRLGPLHVVLVGGSRPGGLRSAFNIGERNVVATRAALRERGLVVAGEDTGGVHSRNVLVWADDGVVQITSPDRDPVAL